MTKQMNKDPKTERPRPKIEKRTLKDLESRDAVGVRGGVARLSNSDGASCYGRACSG